MMDGSERIERPVWTFPELLASALARGPDDLFLVSEEGARMSFAEFDLAARRFAGGLWARGIAPGDRVAIFMDNRAEFVVATYGTLVAGAVCVPINSHLTPTEASYVASHAEARALVTEPRLLARAREIPRDPGLDFVVVAPAAGDETAEDREAARDGAPGTLSWAELLADPVAPATGVRGDDLAFIQYTSGTTAFPKGAMHSHRTLLTAGSARARHLGYGPGDAMLVASPLFHLNAQGVVFMALGAHFRVVLRRKFSASRFWDDVHRHRVTSFNGMMEIPRILLAREAEPGERASPLRTVVGGIDPGCHRAFESRFGVTLVTIYSLTEDPMPVATPGDGFPEEWEDKLGSSGRPVDPERHQIRIVDEAGRDLPPCQTGEIVKRSPATMLGYFKDPAATAAVLCDGWLATGDLGYLDADGFLYVVGRKKDAIRRSGERIAAAEVEAALGSHPGVAEVAVVGVPDPFRGQEVKAFVVLAAGGSPAEVPPAEILAHAARRLAPFKVPRYLEYRAELPRTATLKIRKGALCAGQEVQGPEVFDRARASS